MFSIIIMIYIRHPAVSFVGWGWQLICRQSDKIIIIYEICYVIYVSSCFMDSHLLDMFILGMWVILLGKFDKDEK